MHEVKIWVAVIAAVASLAVAIVNHFSTKSNQRAIEELKDAQKDRDAQRDYEYEARKRLYHECGPILFQLAEQAESMYYRIIGLAGTARQGNLHPGPESFLRDDYYLLSTLYRFLAPSATLRLLQTRLTSVDLSVDAALHREYVLARQVFLALGDEFQFAKLSDPPLAYEPFDEKADEKARKMPAVYWRQGLPLGVFEGAIEALLTTTPDSSLRAMTYAECEAEYGNTQSKVHKEYAELLFLFQDFHPRTRPVLWRMLVTQACLYRVLAQPSQFAKGPRDIRNLRIPDDEKAAFDWRSSAEKHIPESEVSQPFITAERYLNEKLKPRLARI